MPDLTEFRNRISKSGNHTPWGKADTKEIIAEGIIFYTTPSHGGYKVHKRLLKNLPKRFVNLDGWYEEDCEALKVIVAFPQYFSEKTVEWAKQKVEEYFDSEGKYKR